MSQQINISFPEMNAQKAIQLLSMQNHCQIEVKESLFNVVKIVVNYPCVALPKKLRPFLAQTINANSQTILVFEF